jgi:predicted acetyltransferase
MEWILMYRLIKPTIEMKTAYEAYINDWKDESLTPVTSDLKDKTYEQMLDEFYRAEHDINLPKGYVPDSNYFFVNEHKELLGFVNIRHYLDDILFKIRGHIAYGLKPSARGKGLSKIMLELAIEKAREKGIKNILMVCDKSNIASRKTIEACGGVLKDEVYDVTDHEIIQRFWISYEEKIHE